MLILEYTKSLNDFVNSEILLSDMGSIFLVVGCHLLTNLFMNYPWNLTQHQVKIIHLEKKWMMMMMITSLLHLHHHKALDSLDQAATPNVEKTGHTGFYPYSCGFYFLQG